MRRLLALLFLFPAVALAQSGVWGLRGITKRFVVHGDFVYAIDGRGVAAFDATTLQRAGTAETNAESLDGAFTGDTLNVLTRERLEHYSVNPLAHTSSMEIEPSTRLASNGTLLAAAGADGVRVYDGTLLVARWAQNETVRAMAWHGGALFVALANGALPVLDGTTARPVSSVPESALDIAVDGDVLYCATGHNGLATYDISDPLSPRFLARTGDDGSFHQLVAASGGRAVTADVSKSVTVFDVSAPSAPHATPPVAQPVEAMAMSGTRLFVSGSTFDDKGIEHGTGIPLRAYDLGQAEGPKAIGEVQDLAGPVNGAATDGTFAFVSDPPFFRVIDVSTTASPREVASLRLDPINPYVKVRDHRVILYGSGSVQYIDVADPRHPRLIGTFDSLGIPPSSAALTRQAFVEGNPASGFHLFEFRPDGSAQFIGGIKVHSIDIVVIGDAAYYNIENSGVGIADLSGAAPQARPSFFLPNLGVAAAGDLLLVRGVDTLHVFSLADPLVPAEIGAVPLERGGVMTGEEGAAWVASNGTIVRIDLTVPAAPLLQTTDDRVVAPSQIAVSNGKVVVADRYALRVFGPDSAPPPPPPPPPPPRRRPSRP